VRRRSLNVDHDIFSNPQNYASNFVVRRFTFLFDREIRMNKVLLAASLVTFGLGATMALSPSAAHAANANNPYGNVDHSNDAGNDTGDSKVGGLNAQQLNENYKGPLELRAPAGPTTVVPAQPQPGMPPPPPGMAPPPPPGAVVR
jgi:hypothetical protein